jgi:hypothetical protein
MRKFLVLGIVLLLGAVVMSACVASPKADADRYADRFPPRLGVFQQEGNRTVKLTAEAVDNVGHVTLGYEARNLGELYVVIDTYGTESAMEVAYNRRLRDLRLAGAMIEVDRAPRYKVFPRIDIAEMPSGRVALFVKATNQSNRRVIIEAQFIKDDPDVELDDEVWDEVITLIREIGEVAG